MTADYLPSSTIATYSVFSQSVGTEWQYTQW